MIQMNWFDELILEEAGKEAVKLANEMASEMADTKVNDNTIKIEKNFLASGNSIEIVSQNTGLDIETVRKLAEEVNTAAVI